MSNTKVKIVMFALLPMMKENERVLSAAEVKFNFYILKEWFPSIDQAKLGKVMARVKSSKSGNGPNKFLAELKMMSFLQLAAEKSIFWQA